MLEVEAEAGTPPIRMANSEAYERDSGEISRMDPGVEARAL